MRDYFSPRDGFCLGSRFDNTSSTFSFSFPHLFHRRTSLGTGSLLCLSVCLSLFVFFFSLLPSIFFLFLIFSCLIVLIPNRIFFSFFFQRCSCCQHCVSKYFLNENKNKYVLTLLDCKETLNPHSGG